MRNKGKKVQTIIDKSIPSRTDRSFKKECDVNYIMAKFRKTGQISHLAKSQGFYADVSDVPDLLGAFQIARIAEDSFNALPSYLRKKFGSKEGYISFVQDPENDEECINLGLKTARPSSEKKDGTSGGTPKKSVKKESKHESEPKNDSSADA